LLHLIIGFSVKFLAGQFHVHLVDIAISSDAEITPLPTKEEIRILRTEVDPIGIFIT